MKVANIKKTKKKFMGTPLFTGTVSSQTPVPDEDGVDISVNYIHFPKGVRNKFHKHSNDQILIVTEGKGTVATRNKKVKVKKGDVIWAPAGEVHWHGAVPGSKFTHISITKSGTKLTQIEK
jgi:quercetin dioxygenase-like cupin family protein